MKIVQLTEKDLSVLKGCTFATVQKDRDELALISLRDAVKKCGIPDAGDDINEASGEVKGFKLETAEHAALQRLYSEGHGSLRNTFAVLEASIACSQHIKAAKDVEEKQDSKKE